MFCGHTVRLRLSLFGAILFFIAACQSHETKQSTEPHRTTLEEFHTLDWQRQVETVEKMTLNSLDNIELSILSAAVSDDDSAVVVAALEAILRLDREDFLDRVLPLLSSTDPFIRWCALRVVEKFGRDDSLIPKIAALTADREWMVREVAYRTLRNFKSERKTRTYFYPVLLRLSEKNPQVVAEIYRTLIWYDDDSAWPYLMKRSYHCKSVSELVLVMRELARLKTRDAQVRIKTLARSQSVLIREEARRLLDQYF